MGWFVPRMDRYADFGTSFWVRVKHHPTSSWCSIGAYTGGLGYPRVTHVRSARHCLWQPIIDSVSRSTALLPGVLDGSRFNGARLWNRSVFRVGVPLQPVSGPRSSSNAPRREILSAF